MAKFRKGQRVRLNSDYPVGDIMLPGEAAGIVVLAGEDVSQIKFPQGSFLVENEFLEFLEEGFAGVGDEYEISLGSLRAMGEDLMGGSRVGREVPGKGKWTGLDRAYLSQYYKRNVN